MLNWTFEDKRVELNLRLYSRHLVNGHSITGTIQLPDIYLSGNRIIRLPDEMAVNQLTIRLPDISSGNQMVGTIIS